MAILLNSGGIACNLSSTPVTSPMTVMMWVCIVNTGSAAAHIIWELAGETTWTVGTAADGKSLQVVTGSGTYTGPILPMGVWFHLAIQIIPTSPSAQLLRVYVNGALVLSAPSTTAQSYGTMLLGYGAGVTYTIAIEAYKHWNARLLTAAEIRQESKVKNVVRRPGLYCWLPLETGPFGIVAGANITFYMLDKSGYNRPCSQAGTAAGGNYQMCPGPVLQWSQRKRVYT